MSALMIAAMGGHKQTVKYLCHVIDDVDSLDKVRAARGCSD